MFYKHGALKYLEGLLRRPELSQYNSIQTRFQLLVDFVRIMNFLHNSPIGVRVMCDSRTLPKFLAQYLITDDFHLVVNDVDKLMPVTADGACEKRPNVSDVQEMEIKQQGQQNESIPLRFNPPWKYNEKMNIWKLPWVVQRLLGKVRGSEFAKNQLREIMARCHATIPQQRPTAKEVLQELLRVQKLIVTNASHFYKNGTS